MGQDVGPYVYGMSHMHMDQHTHMGLNRYIISLMLLCRAVRSVQSHGVTDHCGRHHKLATFLQENDYVVYAHDHDKYVTPTKHSNQISPRGCDSQKSCTRLTIFRENCKIVTY